MFSCLALCDPLDYKLSGSSVHGIFQARILEWVAVSSSRGVFLTQGSNPRLQRLLHWQADSLLTEPSETKGKWFLERWGYLYPRPHPHPLLYLHNTALTLHHSSMLIKHKFDSTRPACKQSRPYHHHLTCEETEAQRNKVVHQIARLVRSEAQRPQSGTFRVFWQLGDTMK